MADIESVRKKIGYHIDCAKRSLARDSPGFGWPVFWKERDLQLAALDENTATLHDVNSIFSQYGYGENWVSLEECFECSQKVSVLAMFYGDEGHSCYCHDCLQKILDAMKAELQQTPPPGGLA